MGWPLFGAVRPARSARALECQLGMGLLLFEEVRPARLMRAVP